jgi:hypothetical protein
MENKFNENHKKDTKQGMVKDENNQKPKSALSLDYLQVVDISSAKLKTKIKQDEYHSRYFTYQFIARKFYKPISKL